MNGEGKDQLPTLRKMLPDVGQGGGSDQARIRAFETKTMSGSTNETSLLVRWEHAEQATGGGGVEEEDVDINSVLQFLSLSDAYVRQANQAAPEASNPQKAGAEAKFRTIDAGANSISNYGFSLLSGAGFAYDFDDPVRERLAVVVGVA